MNSGPVGKAAYDQKHDVILLLFRRMLTYAGVSSPGYKFAVAFYHSQGEGGNGNQYHSARHE